MPLIFQFGSNCDSERLNSPDRLAGAAKNPRPGWTVEAFEIAFSKWSDTNGCAAADMGRPDAGGRRIWGVLYEVSDEALEKLANDVEGPGYRETEIPVEEVTGQIRTAKTFIVRDQRRQAALWTKADYVRHIVKGLRDHGVEELDRDYLQYVIDRAIRTNEQAEDQEAGRKQNELIKHLL